MSAARPEGPGGDSFVRRALVAAAVAAGALLSLVLLWRSAVVLLLAFAGVLLAVLLRALSDPLARLTRLPPRVSLTAVLLLLAGLAALSARLFLPTLELQLGEVRGTFPETLARLQRLLSGSLLGRAVLAAFHRAFADTAGADLFERWIATPASSATRLLLHAFTMLFVGLFVAYDPRLYLEGAVRLVPPARRPRAREVLRATGHALRLFLLGRAAAMVALGTLTWLVLRLFGVPLASLLGAVTGLFAFVPYLGPLVSGVLVAAVTLAHDPRQLLPVLAIYLLLQNLEDYLVLPLVQQSAVSLAAALTVLLQVLGGVLAGVLGLALATPLGAAGLVLVRMLYLEDALGERAERPGPGG